MVASFNPDTAFAATMTRHRLDVAEGHRLAARSCHRVAGDPAPHRSPSTEAWDGAADPAPPDVDLDVADDEVQPLIGAVGRPPSAADR